VCGIEHMYDLVMGGVGVSNSSAATTYAEMVAPETVAASLQGSINLQHARLVRHMQTVLADGSWSGSGVVSPQHWLCWRAGVSSSTARHIVMVARRASSLPTLMAAFDDGALTLDQVAVACRVPDWADERVTAYARQMTVRQLTTVTRREFLDRPAPEPVSDESVTMGQRDDGRWWAAVRLDADHGSVVESALREARDALIQSGDRQATWADAMVEMARRSLGVAGPERRQRFQLTMHVAADHEGSPIARWSSGRPLPASISALLSCDGDVRRLDHIAGAPVNLGRTMRIVPDRLRKIIIERDGGCRVPGCTNALHLDIHHLIHWSAGGRTDTNNLVTLCSRHHRTHHLGEFDISGNPDQPDGLVLRHRAGWEIPPPTPPPPTIGPPPVGAFRPPTGERLSTRWVDYPLRA
jgi:hypothetical protein